MSGIKAIKPLTIFSGCIRTLYDGGCVEHQASGHYTSHGRGPMVAAMYAAGLS